MNGFSTGYGGYGVMVTGWFRMALGEQVDLQEDANLNLATTFCGVAQRFL